MIIGNCAGDENPDYWFPELTSGTGRPSAEYLKAVAEQTNYALKLCASCPVKSECLAEGMKTEKMSRENVLRFLYRSMTVFRAILYKRAFTFCNSLSAEMYSQNLTKVS